MSTFVAVILSVSRLKLKLQMLLLISILTVRIINPKNKRDFMELMWHNMSEKFDSVKLKLIDSLLEYVPSSPTFQVGYLEGHAHHKHWIVRQEDL